MCFFVCSIYYPLSAVIHRPVMLQLQARTSFFHFVTHGNKALLTLSSVLRKDVFIREGEKQILTSLLLGWWVHIVTDCGNWDCILGNFKE